MILVRFFERINHLLLLLNVVDTTFMEGERESNIANEMGIAKFNVLPYWFNIKPIFLLKILGI